MFLICFFTFCNSFTIRSKSKVHNFTCQNNVNPGRLVYMMWTESRRKARIITTLNETSWLEVADDHKHNGSPRPTLRKQYHVCRLIYEVPTPGPERISILLAKCFPLGSVFATAHRCFSHAENARLFPPRHEWKSMLSFYPGRSQRVIYHVYSGTLISTTTCTWPRSQWWKQTTLQERKQNMVKALWVCSWIWS